MGEMRNESNKSIIFFINRYAFRHLKPTIALAMIALATDLNEWKKTIQQDKG